MEATTDIVENESVWGGGNKPLNASYGKMMMWFFIVSDALGFHQRCHIKFLDDAGYADDLYLS